MTWLETVCKTHETMRQHMTDTYREWLIYHCDNDTDESFTHVVFQNIESVVELGRDTLEIFIQHFTTKSMLATFQYRNVFFRQTFIDKDVSKNIYEMWYENSPFVLTSQMNDANKQRLNISPEMLLHIIINTASVYQYVLNPLRTMYTIVNELSCMCRHTSEHDVLYSDNGIEIWLNTMRHNLYHKMGKWWSNDEWSLICNDMMPLIEQDIKNHKWASDFVTNFLDKTKK